MTPPRRATRRVLAPALAVLALAPTAACDETGSYGGYYSSGSAPHGSTDPEAPATLQAAEAFDIGWIVVDSAGHAIYRHDRDDNDPPRSVCTGRCAETWLPVRARGEPALSGVDPALVGTTTRPDGTDQLTLAGWPLYRYSGDEMAGQTAGQGVDDVWFPIAPDGGKVRAAKTPEDADAGGA
ncbi:putative lipoprotein with Yx(FWY)xxD motif [Prauserella shujinwangii]|uniref:Putative lipoprotein with Yx(FWY)xxD motif n=1 Tax=Prauserella shujinwangii TaxID=1453103 RepID=A0A2T0M3G3_9PSEU|nr:hypothetical protein [Prauserella shujinwangii]PRX51295.1 putative lipoprotein with Yx(FWY)xxD motif [Prauserella shujinwangii]